MPVEVNQISAEIPRLFELNQNYPNPFNPATTIQFNLPKAGYYKMEVFDVLGRKVEELFNVFRMAGIYKFIYNARELSSGLYFYKLSSEEKSLTKKFILIK
jgi:hypothetical protein